MGNYTEREREGRSHWKESRERPAFVRPSRNSAHDGAVKNIATAAHVPAVGKHNRNAAEYPHFSLRAGIPQPLARTEQAGGIGDGAGVKEGAEFYCENAVGVDI